MSCLAYMGQAVFWRARPATKPSLILSPVSHATSGSANGRGGTVRLQTTGWPTVCSSGMWAEASCLRNSSPPNGSNVTSGGSWRGGSGPIPSYSTCAPCGPFTTGPSNRGFSPLRAAILFAAGSSNRWRPASAPAARDAPADRRCRPFGLASQICAGARSFHVQFLHPGHVVRRHDLPAQKRCP